MQKRLAYCMVSISPVRSEAADPSEIVTQLLFGELMEVDDITAPWAHITVLSDGYQGYMDHKHMRFLTDKERRRWTEGLGYLMDRERLIRTPWGTQRICRGASVPVNNGSFNIGNDVFEFLDEPGIEFDSIESLAMDYLNTPYLWGGKSPFGIDCSGITQVIYRLFGFNLPRDASQQADYGTEVDFEDIQSGDLAYFTNSTGKVTHVGILTESGEIIHASGHVRKDLLTREGIIHAEKENCTHPLHAIKRM